MATMEHHHGRLRSSWIWLAVLGVISLIGGILALANPFAATLAANLLAAWTFILFGIVQIVQAFQVRGWPGFLWSLAFGVLTLLVGLSLIVNPGAGIISLTILVGVLFLAVGIVKLFYAVSMRPLSAWLWALLSGVLSILLGIMIFANFPWSATSVLGILLAVELLSNGIFMLMTAFGLRNL